MTGSVTLAPYKSVVLFRDPASAVGPKNNAPETGRACTIRFNPFTPSITIGVSFADNTAKTVVSIYRIDGKRMGKCIGNPNQRHFVLHGTDMPLFPGVYVVRCAIDGTYFNKTVLLTK